MSGVLAGAHLAARNPEIGYPRGVARVLGHKLASGLALQRAAAADPVGLRSRLFGLLG
jgi:hypothetical protein